MSHQRVCTFKVQQWRNTLFRRIFGVQALLRWKIMECSHKGASLQSVHQHKLWILAQEAPTTLRNLWITVSRIVILLSHFTVIARDFVLSFLWNICFLNPKMSITANSWNGKKIRYFFPDLIANNFWLCSQYLIRCDFRVFVVFQFCNLLLRPLTLGPFRLPLKMLFSTQEVENISSSISFTSLTRQPF